MTSGPRMRGESSPLPASTIPSRLATSWLKQAPKERGDGLPSPISASTTPPRLDTAWPKQAPKEKGERNPSPPSASTIPSRLATSWAKQALKERGEGIPRPPSASTTPPRLDTAWPKQRSPSATPPRLDSGGAAPNVVKGRGNGAKDKRKITRSGTSSDERTSLGRTNSPDDEGPSLIGLYGGAIGEKVLKPPTCMRQPLASSLASKRGIIPLANFCRANAALPPLPQSYDELYVHPKTAAGVVAFLSGFNDYVDTNDDGTEKPEETFSVKEGKMKDNERKVNLPLPKTSWGTLTQEPVPQSVQAPVPQSVPQSNPDPSGHHEHQDQDVDVKEIHISQNLQKLEAHGWKASTLKKLVDSQHMGASTLNLLALLEERERGSTQEKEAETTPEDPPKLQEQETDRGEEKDEVLGRAWSTTGSFDATTALSSGAKTPTRNQRQMNEVRTQSTRFVFHAQGRNAATGRTRRLSQE